MKTSIDRSVEFIKNVCTRVVNEYDLKYSTFLKYEIFCLNWKKLFGFYQA